MNSDFEFNHDFVMECRSRLSDPEANLVLAHRTLPEWLGRLSDLNEGENKLQLWFINEHVPDVEARVRAAVAASGRIKETDVIDYLACDVAALYDAFVNLAEDRRPFLSLRVIDSEYFKDQETSVSAHFHRDAAALTLFCCYVGSGTQWTPNHNVRRDYFAAHQKQSHLIPNEQVLHDPSVVFPTPTFGVGVLKGELSPTEPDAGAREFIENFRPVASLPCFNVGKGLIHRGPGRSTAASRLLLTISSFDVPGFLSRPTG